MQIEILLWFKHEIHLWPTKKLRCALWMHWQCECMYHWKCVGSSVQASRWQKSSKVTGYCKLQSMDMCLQSWAGSGLVLVGCKQEGKNLNKYWLLVIFSAAVKTLVPTDSLLVCCIGSAMCKREHQTYHIRASWSKHIRWCLQVEYGKGKIFYQKESHGLFACL